MILEPILVKVGILAGGIFMIIISVIGLAIPINEIGQTISEVNEACQSGEGGIGEWFGASLHDACSVLNYMTLGIYGLGTIGFILIIVGVVVPSKKEYVCKNCNYMTDTRKQIKIHCDMSHENGKYYSRNI